MDSKVFETILGTGEKDGHKYAVHQFVQWYGYLPNWMNGKKGSPWEDWYLVRKSTPCNHNCGTPRWRSDYVEQFRETMGEKDAIFYERSEGIGYVVYKDGVPMTDIPTVGYYDLPDVDIEEVNSWQDYRDGSFKRSFEDPVKIWNTEEYEKLFTPKFKLGETVFCVTYHDSDTRCGERYQVEHMEIQRIQTDMGRIVYHNNDTDFFSIDDIAVPQDRVADTVEELVERFQRQRHEKLYMWDPSSRLGIVECTSTKQYRNAWMK